MDILMIISIPYDTFETNFIAESSFFLCCPTYIFGFIVKFEQKLIKAPIDDRKMQTLETSLQSSLFKLKPEWTLL